MGIDRDLLGRYTLATWGYKQGEMVGLMIHLGVRLGLYQALDGAGPVTSVDLAVATGLHERWLREWLRSQAAAELLASEDGETFLLEPEAAMVRLEPTNPPTPPACSLANETRRWLTHWLRRSKPAWVSPTTTKARGPKSMWRPCWPRWPGPFWYLQ